MKLLDDLKALGYSISLDGENIRLRYLGLGVHPPEAQPLMDALKACKAGAVAYLKEVTPLPHFGPDGGLIIPFGSDPRYHYWAGGQSTATTEEEIRRWIH